MADFRPIYALTHAQEGVYGNSPSDSGNFNSRGELVGTKFGISAKAFESHFKRVPTVADMKALTADQAREIAKSRFWDPNNLDQIKSQRLANIIFWDFWNAGFNGIMRTRRAVNRFADPKMRETRSHFTAAEIQRINTLPEARLYEAIIQGVAQSRVNLGKTNPNHRKYVRGWLNAIKKIDLLGNAQAEISARWAAWDNVLRSEGHLPTFTWATISASVRKAAELLPEKKSNGRPLPFGDGGRRNLVNH